MSVEHPSQVGPCPPSARRQACTERCFLALQADNKYHTHVPQRRGATRTTVILSRLRCSCIQESTRCLFIIYYSISIDRTEGKNNEKNRVRGTSIRIDQASKQGAASVVELLGIIHAHRYTPAYAYDTPRYRHAVHTISCVYVVAYNIYLTFNPRQHDTVSRKQEQLIDETAPPPRKQTSQHRHTNTNTDTLHPLYP